MSEEVATENTPLVEEKPPAEAPEGGFQDEDEEKHKQSRMLKTLGKAWTTVFPAIEIIPFGTFVFLTFFAACPCVAYIVTFTKMAYGMIVYDYFSDNWEPYCYEIGFGMALFATVLYLFDFHYWSSWLGVFTRRLGLTALLIALVVLLFSIAGLHPYGPIIVFLVATTVWMIFVRKIFYPDTEPRTYVSWLGGPFLFLSFVSFVTWIVWIMMDPELNGWSETQNIINAEDSGCSPDFALYPECEDTSKPESLCFTFDSPTNDSTPVLYFPEGCPESCSDIFDLCANLFVLWAGPFFVSIGMFCLSYFVSILRGGTNAEQEMGKFAKIWMMLLFLVWITASLAGVVAGITSTLFALTAACFMASAVFIAVSFNELERQQQLQDLWMGVVEKYGSLLDIGRGLLVLMCAPLFVIYLGIAFVVQSIRKLSCFNCGSPPEIDPALEGTFGYGYLTVEALRLIKDFSSWDVTKVFIFAIYWGIGFMIMSVIVSEFTLLFLSWLIEWTSSQSLGIVTAILVGVGMIMFLLPPVPGVPIYLTLGIVIIAVGRDSLTLVGSMLYATGVSLGLKLLACACQQVLIGGIFKGFPTVRQFVGINSSLIRAMRLILAEPGMSLAKVCILVGGPDWPTSVLCGIMGLPLLPILFGTVPVLVIVIPTTLTGSFTYMAGLETEGDSGTLEFPWASTAATVTAAFFGLIQFSALVSAAYFVEQTITNRKEEIDAIPIDEEVKKLDDEAEKVQAAYEDLRRWKAIPSCARYLLLSSLVFIIVSCYMVLLLSTDCFREFELTYTIDENLDGDWMNLVKPLGWVSMALFVLSWALLQIFVSWFSRKAAKAIKADQGSA